jgi:hypothetical protein
MPNTHPRSLRIAAALVGGLLLLATIACDAAPEQTAESAAPESVVAEATLPAPTVEPADIDRYRYAATLTLSEQRRSADVVRVSTAGRFAAPDRHAIIFKMELVDGTELEQRLVVIGSRYWFKAGGPRWDQTDMKDPRVVELLGSAFSPLRSDFLGSSGLARVQKGVSELQGTPQTVNGVKTLHYTVRAAGKDFIETFLPPGTVSPAQDVEWDIWLAEDGRWPVRVQATFNIRHATHLLDGLGLQAPTRWELRIDVSTPNDPDLMIYPPPARAVR